MATSTTNYSFSLPEVGGDTDQWGTQLNNNWTLADSTIKTLQDSVVDVTLTGNDYLTISGQEITVGDVDLTADVTGTLPVGSGGTGLAALGTANQVLAVNATADGLEFQTVSGSGTVTSVTVSGSDGIEIDSGSPITSSGTIALGINATALSTHLGLGSLATQSTITESQISDLQSYLTAESNDLSSVVTWANVPDINITESSVTQHQAALSITESQISDLQSYLTAEANDLSSSVTWANVPDANITESSVTQHQAALSITESQISDLQSYLTAEVNDLSASVTWANVPDANITQSSVTQHQAALSITESQISDLGTYLTAEVNDLSAAVTWANVPDANITQSSVTQHQAALSITESQISDLGTYLTAETNDLGSAVTGTLGTANGGTGLTSIGTAGQVLKVNSGATALEFADESGGGGSGSSYIEHSSTVSDSLAISSGTNRMYIGNTTFSGSGTMAGYLVISHGYANFTGASALNVTGTLNVVS